MDYLFSPPTFLSTGDKWRQPPLNPSARKGSNEPNFVTAPTKRGQTAANFGGGPCDYRGVGAHPYVEPAKRQAKVRKASKKKFVTPEGFRYASKATHKNVKYKPEGGYEPVQRRDHVAPRNICSAPGKRRNESLGTLKIGESYASEPEELAYQQLVKEQNKHKALIAGKPMYSSATCANRAFGTVENEPEPTKPLYAKDYTRPWTRSGAFRRAVKGGEVFSGVPELLPEPYDDIARRRAALPLRRQCSAVRTANLSASLKERAPFRDPSGRKKGVTRVECVAGAKGRLKL